MMKRLAPIFGGVSLLLIAFLGVGWFLSGNWEAEQSTTLEAPPGEVWPYLVDLERWDAWTVWSDMESTLSDPSSGVGARRSWDDPNYGNGWIAITGADEGERLTYRVELQDGKSWVDGTIRLEPAEEGTTVTWHEAGDFGRNPLMGYMARLMPESQAAQMQESLDRLRAAVNR